MKNSKAKRAAKTREKWTDAGRCCCGGLVRPLPRNVSDARTVALEEAAEHLEMSWTEDPEERHQGTEVSHALRKMAQQLFILSRAETTPARQRSNEKAQPRAGEQPPDVERT